MRRVARAFVIGGLAAVLALADVALLWALGLILDFTTPGWAYAAVWVVAADVARLGLLRGDSAS